MTDAIKPQVKSEPMSAEDFTAFTKWAWDTKGWSHHHLSLLLGCGVNQVGIWRQRGAYPYVKLACAALVAGVSDWRAVERKGKK